MSDTVEFLKFPPLNLIQKYATWRHHLPGVKDQELASLGKDPRRKMAASIQWQGGL